jgi:CBS domain-containing protein
MMRERNVGCLVVVDPAGIFGGWRPVGLLTDRDIVTKALARDCDLGSLVVGEVMTCNPATVLTTTSIEECLQRMCGTGVRRVPVVEDRGCLAGILALDDIFEHLAKRTPFAATPIRPDLRYEQYSRSRPAQPGNMGIDRI